jgi:hypothetical protein
VGDYFTIIPNNIFYTEEGKTSLYKQIKNYKIILIMDYLYTGMNRIGNTRLSIGNIITNYNCKFNRNKGGINEQILDILIKLNEIKIIEGNLNLDNISINQLIEYKYNGIEKDKNGNYINFTMIDYKVFNKILNYKEGKVDNVSLLFYYCYLASRMFTRKSDKKDIRVHGGKAEVCYPSYETITKDTDISARTISKYNDILVSMNLIRIGNLGLYYVGDNKKYTRESPNFYVLIKDEEYVNTDNEKNMLWHINLTEAMKYFKKAHKDYTFINTREYKDNNKSNNGYIARINQLEKEGKATKKQINKRDRLVNERENSIIQTK